jgi:hypothetical protein
MHRLAFANDRCCYVKALGKAQGFKSLMFKIQCSIIMQDVDWTAGVDYEDSNEAPPNKEQQDQDGTSTSNSNKSYSSDSDEDRSDSSSSSGNNNDGDENKMQEVTQDEIDEMWEDMASPKLHHHAENATTEEEKVDDKEQQGSDEETEPSAQSDIDAQHKNTESGHSTRKRNPLSDPFQNACTFKGKSYAQVKKSQVTFTDQQEEVNSTLE